MSKFEIQLPKMGESIIEATITKWLKKEGDPIQEDESLAEIATDKVDSEIPSPVAGTISKIMFKEGDVVPVGTVIAVIDEEGEGTDDAGAAKEPEPKKQEVKEARAKVAVDPETQKATAETDGDATKPGYKETAAPPQKEEQKAVTERFYSPLVKQIAKQENIAIDELNAIPGTGMEGRLTKNDLLEYLKNRTKPAAKEATPEHPQAQPRVQAPAQPTPLASGDQVIEMDRVRQLISAHMTKSVTTSAHVTSFIEADMTNAVVWREKTKNSFQKKEGIKLTFSPVFIEAIAKAVRDIPMVNVSVDGTRIILHKNINIGMAVALPNDNLIVPVIKNADQKNLLGLIKNVTDIAERARQNKLIPDEIAGGSISMTNFGSFGTLMGTPIINQPQTAIIGVGTIVKRPVVMETPAGDMIAIRQMMFLSITYDHRVIDGALAGKFLNRMKFHLENFDLNQTL